MTLGLFDSIAESYNICVPPLPEKFVNLLMTTFQIKQEERVLDLGCGSGNLALQFATQTDFVEGIDASRVMIQAAEMNDTQKSVKWIHKNVEAFNFEKNAYKLIYAYEAFHLFSQRRNLIKRFADALKPGGFLCVGWTVYEWDLFLKEEIADTFASYGIYRGEWGLWTCPTFAEDIKAKSNLSKPVRKDVAVRAQTPIKTIVDFILSNSKSAELNDDLKPIIAKDLTRRFLKIYPSGESDGYAVYSFLYTKKQ
jgi:ubiquinone/menaquinone biosynthesis C-methylase UbiE